jgi:hypothetical protein
MSVAFLIEPPPAVSRRPLTEDDAVDMWIARWLRIQPVDLQRRYARDPRRPYEIWDESYFPGSRAWALEEFHSRFPGLEARFDPGPHRRIPTTPHPDR